MLDIIHGCAMIYFDEPSRLHNPDRQKPSARKNRRTQGEILHLRRNGGILRYHFGSSDFFRSLPVSPDIRNEP